MSGEISEQVRSALQHVEFLNKAMAEQALGARVLEEHQVLITDDSLLGVVAVRSGLPAHFSVGAFASGADVSDRGGQDVYNTPAATYSLSSSELEGTRLGLYKWPATAQDIQGKPYRPSEWIREPFGARSEIEQGTFVHGLPFIGNLRLLSSLLRSVRRNGPRFREQAMPPRIMTIFSGSLTLMGEVKRPRE